MEWSVPTIIYFDSGAESSGECSTGSGDGKACEEGGAAGGRCFSGVAGIDCGRGGSTVN